MYVRCNATCGRDMYHTTWQVAERQSKQCINVLKDITCDIGSCGCVGGGCAGVVVVGGSSSGVCGGSGSGGGRLLVIFYSSLLSIYLFRL